MFAFLRGARKFSGAIIAVLSLVWLTACGGGFGAGGGGPRIDTSRPVPVALLVPSGGGNAADDALASSLENAARLAMRELDGVTIDLRVYSTAGSTTQAAAVAKQAVSEGAKVILGPVYAQNAASAGVAARSVNVLSFSNNPSIAGGNVFILGNTFENSADRLTRYAARQGKGDIFIVNAQDPAEELGRAAIERAIAGNGARLAGTASFPLSQQGVIDSAGGIADQIRASGASSVFLTSGTAGALPFVAELLPENGIRSGEVQYIGLQRLDIPASALSLSGLQGAWFATPSPALSAQFTQRYQAAYGSQPHPIAGVAYDGIAAVGALIAQGRDDALTADALTQGQGFAGVYGPFRFLRNGTNERGLAVAEIRNNQVVVIDPAPRSFGGAGF